MVSILEIPNCDPIKFEFTNSLLDNIFMIQTILEVKQIQILYLILFNDVNCGKIEIVKLEGDKIVYDSNLIETKHFKDNKDKIGVVYNYPN